MHIITFASDTEHTHAVTATFSSLFTIESRHAQTNTILKNITFEIYRGQ